MKFMDFCWVLIKIYSESKVSVKEIDFVKNKIIKLKIDEELFHEFINHAIFHHSALLIKNVKHIRRVININRKNNLDFFSKT